jgi:hypothetical protein
MKNFKLNTKYSLSDKNFLVGLGSILNISGSYFDIGSSNFETTEDLNSFKMDWQNIGNDFDVAKEKFISNSNKELV